MKHPKLRDIGKLTTREFYPLNEMPDELVLKLGGYLIYLFAIGRKDISGSDWGDVFANSIGGNHLDSPVGIVDVVREGMGWSEKTVKHQNPHNAISVRLISGRCSPDDSYGITDPHKDIQQTGRAVLGIWNERVSIAQDNYRYIRTSVLVRSDDLSNFLLFEEENRRFRTNDYFWEVNKNGNLIGKDVETGEVRFTWQPHGSQLTIHTKIPTNVIRFSVRKPVAISKESVLDSIHFDESWIRIER